MFQIIMDHTRKQNTLDLIIANNEDIVRSYEQQVNTELSDQNAVVIIMDIVPDISMMRKPIKKL